MQKKSGLIFALLFVMGCSWQPRRANLELSGRQSTNPRILVASSPKACNTIQKKRLWALLFGAVALNDWNLPRPQAGRAYRISEKMLWSDVAITVFGGWLLSLSTRTLFVESCPSDFRLVSKEEQARRSAFLDWAKGQQVHLETISGQSYTGRLHSVGQDLWEIQIESDPDQDLLVFKDGRVLAGKLVSHIGEFVRFETQAGIQRYPKSEVKKIRFAANHAEPLLIHIPTEGIQKISFLSKKTKKTKNANQAASRSRKPGTPVQTNKPERKAP